MTNPWQEYKKKLGTTRPWDVVNPNIEKATEEEAIARYKTCLDCDRFLNITKQCKECGCVMPLKTKLKNATCPIGRW
jgi:hypothetical protein